MRANFLLTMVALLALAWSPAAIAAHGGVGGGGHGGGASGGGHGSSAHEAAPVKWCDKTVADLLKDCSDPFAIYFCTEETAKYAGCGSKVVADCHKANPQCKPTIWESATVLHDLKSAGIDKCLKVAATKDNQELFKKYGAGGNTLVLCAPNGDKLLMVADAQCSEANVCKELQSFKDKLDGWKDAQKKAKKEAKEKEAKDKDKKDDK